MTAGSVLDILIYVFDRYMLNEVPEVPEREHLARDLERAGFARGKVERAHEQATRLAAQLADDEDAKALQECAELTARGTPRARSELLPKHIGWLPLTSTPRGPRGLSALTPTQFRLFVLAVLALVAGGTIVLVRRFASAR